MSSEELSPSDRSSLAAERGPINMAVGGVLAPEISRFLAGAGFRLDYTVSGVAVYRPAGAGPVT